MQLIENLESSRGAAKSRDVVKMIGKASLFDGMTTSSGVEVAS